MIDLGNGLYQVTGVRINPLTGKYVTRGREAVCPVCNEILGVFFPQDGYSAEWWVDKTLQEHLDERHD